MVVTGLIRPPPEIRAVADRTALFVAKNGRAFESRILNSEKGRTPKFAFLHGTSPFHAYYEDRIAFYEGGGTDEQEREGEEKKKEEEEEEAERKKKQEEEEEEEEEQKRKKAAAAAISSRGRKASAVDPIARTLLAQRAKIEAAWEEADRAASAENKAEAEEEAAAAEGGAEAMDTDEPSDEAKAEGGEADEGGKPKPTGSTTGPVPPPALKYVTLAAPRNLPPAKLETIKLTAQYAALAGRGNSSTFLKDLTFREWTNPLFDFVQPRNAAFAYFTALVDVYRSVMAEGVNLLAAKNKDAVDGVVRERYAAASAAGAAAGREEEEKGGGIEEQIELCAIPSSAAGGDGGLNDLRKGMSAALEIAAYRAEYDRDAAERRLADSEASGGGGGLRGGASSIDWHDFVVVETIDFDADEVVEAVSAPPPMLMGDTATEKKTETEEGKRGEDEMEESEDEDMGVGATRAAAAAAAAGGGAGGGAGDESISIDPTYQPRVVSTAALTHGDRSKTHVIDPITGKSVPVSDLSEHMRIQLLDPKWTEERKKFLDRQRESNIVGGEDIASNIQSFARERGDIFGSSEQELLNREADSKKRLEEANRIIREQAQLPGPSLPPPPSSSATSTAATSASAATAAAAAAPPPPLPPQPAAVAAVPPHPAAPAAAPVPPPPPPLPATTAPAVQHAKPDGLELPAAKKARVDAAATVAAPAVPPPPPPPAPPAANAAAAVPPPPPPPPPAAAAAAPTGEPPAPDGAPPAEEEPAAKVLSEADFAATLPDPRNVPLSVKVPNDPTAHSSWNFDGRTVSVTVDVTAKIKAVKEALQSELGGMPVNKMQLRMSGLGFLKDGFTLAKLNIGPGTTLDLVPKVRGGRK